MRSATCQIWRGELEGQAGTNKASLGATTGHEAEHCERELLGSERENKRETGADDRPEGMFAEWPRGL